jgi:hypothetical protein
MLIRSFGRRPSNRIVQPSHQEVGAPIRDGRQPQRDRVAMGARMVLLNIERYCWARQG